MIDIVNQCEGCGANLNGRRARFCSKDCKLGRKHVGWGQHGAIWHAVVKAEGEPSRFACDGRIVGGAYLSVDAPSEKLNRLVGHLCDRIGCYTRRAPMDPMHFPILDEMSVTTTAGERFTGQEHAQLAALVFKRFGWDVEQATAAWSRMLGSNVTAEQFQTLAGFAAAAVRRGLR